MEIAWGHGASPTQDAEEPTGGSTSEGKLYHPPPAVPAEVNGLTPLQLRGYLPFDAQVDRASELTTTRYIQAHTSTCNNTRYPNFRFNVLSNEIPKPWWQSRWKFNRECMRQLSQHAEVLIPKQCHGLYQYGLLERSVGRDWIPKSVALGIGHNPVVWLVVERVTPE